MAEVPLLEVSRIHVGRVELVLDSVDLTRLVADVTLGAEAELARAGSELGVMSHTVSSTQWHDLRFNGALVGEVGINAALCGTWGCPVALVTGDDVVCA